MKKLVFLAALFCFAAWGFGCDKTKAVAKVKTATPVVTAAAAPTAPQKANVAAKPHCAPKAKGTVVKGACAPKVAKSCCASKKTATVAAKPAKAVKAAKQGDI